MLQYRTKFLVITILLLLFPTLISCESSYTTNIQERFINSNNFEINFADIVLDNGIINIALENSEYQKDNRAQVISGYSHDNSVIFVQNSTSKNMYFLMGMQDGVESYQADDDEITTKDMTYSTGYTIQQNKSTSQYDMELTVDIILPNNRNYFLQKVTIVNTDSTTIVVDEISSHIHDGLILMAHVAGRLGSGNWPDSCANDNLYIHGTGDVPFTSTTGWGTYAPNQTKPFATLYDSVVNDAITGGLLEWATDPNQIIRFYKLTTPEPRFDISVDRLELAPAQTAEYVSFVALHDNGEVSGEEIYDQVKSEYQAVLNDEPIDLEPKWTIMHYMCADNNLETFAIDDINELEAGIDSSNDVNILVLVDRHPYSQHDGGGYTDEDGDWTGTRLYQIEHDETDSITSTLLFDYGEEDLGIHATLNDFLDYCLDNYPAQHYMLNLWNHGAGVLGCCFDETNSNHYLRMDELQQAITTSLDEHSEKLDIISYLPACRMGMVEVAYEFRNIADYFIGSEEVIWANYLTDLSYIDWEYIVDYLLNNINISPEDFASEIVDNYESEYQTESLEATLSLIDLGELSTLPNLFNAYFDIVYQAILDGYIDNIFMARDNVKEFRDSVVVNELEDLASIDLIHLIELIQADSTLTTEYPALVSNAFNLQNKLDDIIIANYAHSQKSQNANGLAIFMPKNSDYSYLSYYINEENDFQNLDWLEDTNWNDYLAAFCSEAPTELSSISYITIILSLPITMIIIVYCIRRKK
ncbi:MAG: clostripain-related cysteine peptidase [Candidatus Heimdallarchaeota archaeon]